MSMSPLDSPDAHGMLYVRVLCSNLTLTVEELVVAARLGFPDDALHPPVRDLDVEALVGTRRVHSHIVLPPFLLLVDGHGSAIHRSILVQLIDLLHRIIIQNCNIRISIHKK